MQKIAALANALAWLGRKTCGGGASRRLQAPAMVAMKFALRAMGVSIWSDELQRKAEELQGQGLSYRAIARELGVSVTPVRRALIPGEAERCRAAVKKHYRNHQEKVLSKAAKYREKNRGILKEKAAEHNKNNRERQIWHNMIKRCTDPNTVGYEHYGARGIAVCERWARSFDAFLADMGPKPSSRHTLERRDTMAGYSPENCCWATWAQQASNRRNTRVVEIFGEIKTLGEISRKYDIGIRVLYFRLNTGWLPEEAATTPHLRGKRMKRKDTNHSSQPMKRLYAESV